MISFEALGVELTDVVAIDTAKIAITTPMIRYSSFLLMLIPLLF
ncbi:hypothetical protein [Methanococcus sp. CF]